MEQISQVIRSGRYAVDLPVGPFLMDHRIGSRIVYPAVLSMEVIADTIVRHSGLPTVKAMSNIRFDRFLPVPENNDRVPAFCEISTGAGNAIDCVLMTHLKSKASGISRKLRHVEMTVCAGRIAGAPQPTEWPLEEASTEISAETIYRELVPFGPAFRNIHRRVGLSRKGAAAWLAAPTGPRVSEVAEKHLGSPFPLDAAFHAACVWGQMYAGIVAYPIGIEQRVIYRPTRGGGIYLGRVFPKPVRDGTLCFDIEILDPSGSVRETAFGVRMRDVTGGRIKPPQWLKPPGDENT